MQRELYVVLAGFEYEADFAGYRSIKNVSRFAQLGSDGHAYRFEKVSA